MQTQHQRMAKLLTRKKGANSLELAQAAPSLSIHKRISELTAKGWTVVKKRDQGKLTVYYGTPPKVCK